LREDLNNFVKPEFGEVYEVRREFPDSGITGFLVRKDWRGADFPERQRELHDFLEERFGAESGDVSLILTFTPEEYAEWAEDKIAV